MTFAQNEDLVDPSDLLQKRNGRMWQLGKEAKRTGNYYLALHYFENVYQRDTNNLRVLMELAELYRHTHNYPKTEQFYQKIVQSPKYKKHPESVFYLAQAQKNNGKYTEAKQNLLKFKKNLKLITNPDLKKLYKSELDGCELILTPTKDSNAVVIRNIGDKVNHPHIDFSPVPIGESELLYGSYPVKEERIYKLDSSGNANTGKRMFLRAEKTANGWKKIGEFDEVFNDTLMDVANACFSLDSTRLYFSKCSTNWKYQVNCTIYESRRHNGRWSKPKPLNELINMPEFTSTHPTIGRESRKNHLVLYFVSNREGGKGGTDIWFAEYDPRKGTFKKPRNAGSKVNTVGNETTPFYDLPSKTLYFSSDGRPNIGGLDIFSTVGETNSWQEPINLGPTVNSSADDLDYVLRSSNRGGFFVSNRPGGYSLYHETCCDDIYEFEFSRFIDIDLELDILDVADNQNLKKGAIVNVYLLDKGNRFLVQSDTSNLKKIKLRSNKEYEIEVKKAGYYQSRKPISTKEIIENTKLKQEVKLEKTPVEPFVMPNINFEFDSPKLTPDSKLAIDTTLLKLFRQQPNIKIEISAHSDSKGSDSYNLTLSQKRAESLVKYLQSRGVPLNQMVPKGYGETKPIAPNTNADGTDNPEGRKKNRRIELKILGEIEEVDDETD